MRLEIFKRRYRGFTLVELIVVVTILAILATIGFLALSGYSQDAKDSAIKANVRSVQTAISSEAALTNQSPRYYVVHDTDYALSGAFVYVDGSPVTLTGWDVGSAPADSNYTAGKPNWVRLKLNPEKFKVTGIRNVFEEVFAAYDAKSLSVWAMDSQSVSASGRKRTTSWMQVVGVSPSTKVASVLGNFPQPSASESALGATSGLVRDPNLSATGAIVDGSVAGTVASPGGQAARSDPAQSSVAMLMHFDGRTDNGDASRNSVGLNLRMEWTNGSTTVIDDAGNTVVANGNAAISSANKAMGATSVELDGAGDYLKVPDSSTIRPGSGDFTIEGWVKTNWSSTTVTTAIASQYNTATAGEYILGIRSGVVYAWVWASSYNGTKIVNDNAWHHVAWVRQGTGSNNNKVFVDGQFDFQFTNTSDVTWGGVEFNAGRWFGNTTSCLPWYLDDIRITKGVARYSSAFTPQAIPAFSGPTYKDEKNLSASVFGNPTISLSQKKFGDGSLALDGTDDHLEFNGGSNFAFGTGDFTIEGWFYRNSGTNNGILQLSTVSNGFWLASQGIAIAAYVDKMQIYHGWTGGWERQWNIAIASNQWTHFALQRSSGIMNLYVNGVKDPGFGDFANTVDYTMQYGNIGGYYSTSYLWNGYVDDVRVTKGVARYSSNFTPPTSAYPN